MDTDEATAGDQSDTNIEIEPIDLHLCHGKILVWNAQDVKVLREVHHIVGSLVGGLPRAPRQNTQMGLPMQLMPEEANVLLEYGAARLLSMKAHKPNSSDVAKFEDDRRKSFVKQKELWSTKQAKKKEELSHIIEVGRMSRKQRRAEKAMKKKLKQEAAKSKLQAHQESVQLESNLPQTCTNLTETEQQVTSNRGDGTADSAKLIQESSPDRVLQQHDGTKVVDVPSSGFQLNIPVNGRHGDELHVCKIQTSCSVKPNCRGNQVTQTSQEQRTSPETKAHSKECEMSVELEKQKGHSSKERTSHIQVGTLHKESEMFVESYKKEQSRTEMTSHHQVEMSVNIQQQQSCQDITTHRQIGTTKESGMSVETQQELGNKHKTSHQVVPSHKECGIMEDEDSKTNKQNERSDDQGCLIQLFTGTPKERVRHIEIPDWDYPETPHEAMRCRVFQNFWEQGYYLTSGSKFGGDFLAYPGDPFLYHSFYIIICLPYKKQISPLDIVAFGRMASNVKKTVVLCSVDEIDEVVYTSVQWTGIS